MDLFEDSPAPDRGNQPEFTVSELSGAVKRVIEGEFGLVRVRGEIGRVSRPASGHLYYDLKDDRSVIAAITWKGQAARLTVRPEEGMEVIATGRMTTFPGQSKYQLIIDDIAPAGAGALMAMLEKRRAHLQAEGLFDPARKKALPSLPRVIGVVTSPSGAVIRDILHRLRERFPCHVLIWPVAVQGEKCAPEVAAAIRGFNQIAPGGPIPRPDLLIVARGGGSLEDLWGFNEEIVVRAAAASQIPLISAVGHETDTTLIDFASDLRAPTPTAAAEIAVPVRFELLSALDALGARLSHVTAQSARLRRQRLADLARALPRPEALTALASQRLDHAAGRLSGSLTLMASRKRGEFERIAARLRADLLRRYIRERGLQLAHVGAAAEARFTRRLDQSRNHFALWAARLSPSFERLVMEAQRQIARQRDDLARLGARLDAAQGAVTLRGREHLARLDRMRVTLGPDETMQRGFAVIRAGAQVVTSAAVAQELTAMEITFHDGRVAVVRAEAGPEAAPTPAPAKAPRAARSRVAEPPKDADGGGQGSLF